MIKTDKRLRTPRWNKVVWRYMDLPKFLDLITTEKLFFANASQLTDKYEGILPEKNIIRIKDSLISRLGISEQEALDVAREENEIIRSHKKYTMVNCWSMHKEESYALWKIYLGNSASGIAIRTNVKALTDSIKCQEDLYLGEVQYNNYIKEEHNIYTVITRKTPYYKYEKELRLFIPRQLTPTGKKNEITDREIKIAKHPYGMRIPVNIDLLIHDIYISPFVGDWFESVLREVLKKVKPSLLPRIKRSLIQDR